jgi:hypothetical protein
MAKNHEFGNWGFRGVSVSGQASFSQAYTGERALLKKPEKRQVRKVLTTDKAHAKSCSTSEKISRHSPVSEWIRQVNGEVLKIHHLLRQLGAIFISSSCHVVPF